MAVDLFVKAVYDKLVGSGALTAMLATSPVVGVPGVYAVDPIPESAGYPYVVIRGPIVAAPFDTKVESGDGGRDLTIDVNCVGLQTGTMSEVDGVANLVRSLLHRQALPVAGYQWVDTQVFGPTPLDFEDVYTKNLAVQVLYAGA